jgi:hypothetical protein
MSVSNLPFQDWRGKTKKEFQDRNAVPNTRESPGRRYPPNSGIFSGTPETDLRGIPCHQDHGEGAASARITSQSWIVEEGLEVVGALRFSVFQEQREGLTA